MALINKMLVGKSLVGDGNEVAHIDLIMGPRGSAAELAFANALVNNKDGFTTLLAVVAPNLLCKPNTILFNKVTIKGAKQAVQMFGPAQHGVAKAVADSVAEGVIPLDEADDIFICGRRVHSLGRFGRQEDPGLQLHGDEGSHRPRGEGRAEGVRSRGQAQRRQAPLRAKLSRATDAQRGASMGFPPSRGRPSRARRPPLTRRCGAINGGGRVFSLAGRLAASVEISAFFGKPQRG